MDTLDSCRPRKDRIRALWALVRGESGLLAFLRGLSLLEFRRIDFLLPVAGLSLVNPSGVEEVSVPKIELSVEKLLFVLLTLEPSLLPSLVLVDDTFIGVLSFVLDDLKLRKSLFISDVALDNSDIMVYFSEISSLILLLYSGHIICTVSV